MKYPLVSDLLKKQDTTTHLQSNPPRAATSLRYVAIGVDGDIVGVDTELETAISRSQRGGGTTVVEDFTNQLERADAHENPPPAIGKMAQHAFDALGVPRLELEQVLSISLEDAYAELLPYYKPLKDAARAEGRTIVTYDTPNGMVNAFLGQNYKTAKQHPEAPSDVMGLTLFPADKVREYLDFDSSSPVSKLIKKSLPQLDRQGFTSLCVGSNRLCRESCLVFSGRNAADIYNHQKKAAATMAFLQAPEAFCRILVAAIEKHAKNAPRERVYQRAAGRQVKPAMKPYVRLNVLSDIPWEIVLPGLFGYYDDTELSFYDYTKVAGRHTPANYDITFSFSGTNEALARSEIARGRRVAVVFMGMREEGRGDWVPFREGSELPKRFWGLPVVDGDVSDVRPLDPAPCIVGLRWKTPKGRGIDPTTKDFKFVVPAYHTFDVELDKPRGNPARSDRGEYLVVPVTPRYQPDTYE